MWLYLVYFLLYTIINPTVPFAWLHFGYSVYPVHDGVCMCVYVCLHTKEAVFFLPSADLWACLGAGVCLCMCVCVLTLGFPEHCDSSGMCTWVEETKTFCPDCSISFDPFARLTRTRSGMLVVEKSGTKKTCSFMDNTMSNTQFEFWNICMFVWKFCKCVILCTF